MKWIDLAATRKGAAKAAKYRDVLTLAEGGVERGFVSFPLSAIHYIETNNRRDRQSRLELADTMATLSRYHTIAPLNALVRPEIDLALQQLFGRPLTVRHEQVFGVGVAHAMHQDFGKYRAPDDVPADFEYRWFFETLAAEMVEWVALAGLPPETGADESQFDALQAQVGAELAQAQEHFRLVRREGRWHAGECSKRVHKAAALKGWRDELTEALERAGLGWSHVYALGRDGMSRLIEAIPIIHVGAELTRQREAAGQSPWTAHDVNDLFFLMVALVYCDIVVTERQWVDLAMRSGLDERYGTLVTSDLESLLPHLLGCGTPRV
jgi:hypothetical protein